MILPALDPTDVVWVSDLRHRLALGLSLHDMVSGMPATGTLVAQLESIGPFALQGIPLQAHGPALHALPWDGKVRKLMDLSLKRGLPPDWVVRLHGDPGAVSGTWNPQRETRRYLPRRLKLRPALNGNEPAIHLENARSVGLWPGATYPVPGAATAVRGRVLHNATTVMPWARVLATVPAGQMDLTRATVVARAQADDTGEFLMVLGSQAVAGAALPPLVTVRIWAFGPPAPPDPNLPDPLSVLPIEDAGTSTDSPLLRGEVVPAAYTERQIANALGAPVHRRVRSGRDPNPALTAKETPMPEYLAPGVFVEEVSFRSKSIEGVPTSTTGFVGPTRYGPIHYAGGPSGTAPRLVTSFTEFERAYGGLDTLAPTNADPDTPNYVAHAARALLRQRRPTPLRHACLLRRRRRAHTVRLCRQACCPHLRRHRHLARPLGPAPSATCW